MINLRSLRRICQALALICAGTFATVAAAHPDYWVKVKYQFSFDETAITALDIRWTFDVFYSARAIERFDLDGDMVFSDEETRALERDLFAPLATQAYFVEVFQGDSPQQMQLGAFAARIDDPHLEIRFTLLPQTPVPFREAPVFVATHDDKAYDFTLAESDFLTVDGPYDPTCKFRVAPGTGPLDGVAQTVVLLCPD